MKVFILAGESSGDRLGAALMAALRRAMPEIEIVGVGGDAMAAQGLSPVFPMRDIAVMGFGEVVPHLPVIFRRLAQATQAASAPDIDAVVMIDAQVFSALLAKRLRKRGTRAALVQYVAPTVWAWKPWRARKLARVLDRILTLFPFEPPYFEAHGLAADCVGHPLIEARAALPDDAGGRLRDRLGIDRGAPVLLLALGSRMSELTRLAEPFIGAAERLRAAHPGLEIIAPLAPGIAEEAGARLAASGLDVHTLDPRARDDAETVAERFAAFAAADVALAASGTVTLEIAAMATPMVVGYRASKLTEFILRRLVKVESGVLVNLILGQRIIDEYWQDDCAPAPLAAAVSALLADGAERGRHLAGYARAMEALGGVDAPPSERAARGVLAAIEERWLTPR